MILKLIGSLCIILSCGGFGYYLAWQYFREETCLRQMILLIEYMKAELQYNLMPLPKLLYNCVKETDGVVANILYSLTIELEQQLAPDVDYCMRAVISRTKNIPMLTRKVLLSFGKQLGKYDLIGQLQCLDEIKRTCNRHLDTLTAEKHVRLRRYKTLGLCAGAGLVILFI